MAGRVYCGQGYPLPWTLLHAEAEVMRDSRAPLGLDNYQGGG